MGQDVDQGVVQIPLVWGHMMYFSTDGKAYQVFNCNAETHEDWMQTSRDVDIIYISGPEGELRIKQEPATHENYLGGEMATICYIHNQMVYACII